MAANGRTYVYAWLTEDERDTFEAMRVQEDCSISDFIRMALNEVAERYYGIPNAVKLLHTPRRKPTKR